MLTDDAQNPRQHPTRENIVNAMQWLVRGAAPNDSLFFHCNGLSLSILRSLKKILDSGHGGQTKDLDGDEGDGHDEGSFYLLLV
jgi:hypothetical protein